jgi:hypothetical protein
VRGLVAAWDRAVHEPQPVIGLAVFRILFGLVVLLTLLLVLPDAGVWFGARGVLSPEGSRLLVGPWRIDPLAWLPAPAAWLAVTLAVGVLSAACLALGLWTRTSALVVFVVLALLHHRNPLIWNGGDWLQRVLALLLVLSPAGEALSLDRVLARGRTPGPPPWRPPWPQRLIQVQVAVMYLTGGLWKLTGTRWLDGTAVYYSARLVEFQRFPVPVLFEYQWTLELLTWGTIGLELALGTLIWIPRLRYPLLVAGAVFHLGLEYAMNIPTFQLTALAGLTAFVEPRDAARWLARRRPGS